MKTQKSIAELYDRLTPADKEYVLEVINTRLRSGKKPRTKVTKKIRLPLRSLQ